MEPIRDEFEEHYEGQGYREIMVSISAIFALAFLILSFAAAVSSFKR